MNQLKPPLVTGHRYGYLHFAVKSEPVPNSTLRSAMVSESMPPSRSSNECFKVEWAIEFQMLRAGRWVLKSEKAGMSPAEVQRVVLVQDQ